MVGVIARMLDQAFEKMNNQALKKHRRELHLWTCRCRCMPPDIKPNRLTQARYKAFGSALIMARRPNRNGRVRRRCLHH